MSTSTRQQLAEVIADVLSLSASYVADAVEALAGHPELLRALANQQLPAAPSAGYVIARHEDATKYGGDRTLSLWCDDVWKSAGGALTGHAEHVDEDGWHVFGLVEIPLPDYDAEVARATTGEAPAKQGSAKHSADDRCFYCATDEELAAGLTGRNRRTIHMSLPVEACPESDPADFKSPTPGGEVQAR